MWKWESQWLESRSSSWQGSKRRRRQLRRMLILKIKEKVKTKHHKKNEVGPTVSSRETFSMENHSSAGELFAWRMRGGRITLPQGWPFWILQRRASLSSAPPWGDNGKSRLESCRNVSAPLSSSGEFVTGDDEFDEDEEEAEELGATCSSSKIGRRWWNRMGQSRTSPLIVNVSVLKWGLWIFSNTSWILNGSEAMTKGWRVKRNSLLKKDGTSICLSEGKSAVQ